jgi:hypothetical protein
MPITKSNLEVKILDELADGQWHPLYKIRKKIDTTNISDKLSKETLASVLDRLAGEGILLSGNNESYRFESNELKRWRIVSETLDRENRQYQPRFFGGILEDDGWMLAELKTYDLIHFRADSTIGKQEIVDLTGEKPSVVQIDEDGLFRIFTTPSSATYHVVKNTKITHPEWKISGVRLEKSLKRRDLDDLPNRFVSDLCQYYGVFAKVLLRSHMSSITKHMSEPDDIQQQIYMWIIDAIQRYDATTSIPFGAYLGTALKKWVFNLNRKAFGRSVADAELKHTRAIAEFKVKWGREPKQEELATLLETDLVTVRKDAMAINTVLNLRNTGTIYQEDNELPIPSGELTNDNIDSLIDNMLLSAAITTAANVHGGSIGLAGLTGVYYENWGSEQKNKKVSIWLKNPKTQDSISAVLEDAKQILRGNEKK